MERRKGLCVSILGAVVFAVGAGVLASSGVQYRAYNAILGAALASAGAALMYLGRRIRRRRLEDPAYCPSWTRACGTLPPRARRPRPAGIPSPWMRPRSGGSCSCRQRYRRRCWRTAGLRAAVAYRLYALLRRGLRRQFQLIRRGFGPVSFGRAGKRRDAAGLRPAV